MKVHLVDGTYELFRCYYGAPAATANGREVGATRGLVATLLALLTDEGATHVGVAFDTVIESFRNELFGGYKTGAGIDQALWGQFPLAEEAARALGITTWSMMDFEADDAMATMGALCAAEPEVEQVLLCSPDKDLAQCVRGDRVVLVDRRRKQTYNEAAVLEKYGVPPVAIPDLLALVGDTADGIPGIDGFGMKGAAAALRAFGSLEAIPDDPAQWGAAGVRGAAKLAATLSSSRTEAALYKKLATLRLDVPLEERHARDLEWRGADRAAIERLQTTLGDTRSFRKLASFRD